MPDCLDIVRTGAIWLAATQEGTTKPPQGPRKAPGRQKRLFKGPAGFQKVGKGSSGLCKCPCLGVNSWDLFLDRNSVYFRILVPFWFQKSKLWFHVGSKNPNCGSILVPKIEFCFHFGSKNQILVPKIQFWFHFGSKTSILVPKLPFWFHSGAPWGPWGPWGPIGPLKGQYKVP